MKGRNFESKADNMHPLTIGILSIGKEMGQRRRPEVKFSRANLLGMRKVIKTSSSLRGRNSIRFAVVAKT